MVELINGDWGKARTRLEEAVKTDSADAIRKAMSGLEEAAQAVAKAVYEKVGQQQTSTGPTGPGPGPQRAGGFTEQNAKETPDEPS